MNKVAEPRPLTLEVAHLSRPAVGEVHNGDAVFVRTEGEQRLFAVIDGLGHGPAAEAAAGICTDFLATASLSSGLTAIMQGMHKVARGTRGTAACLCLMDGHKLSACSVGNVELLSIGASVPMLQSPGVVGVRLARLRVAETTVTRGTRLVLYTDGIIKRFARDEIRRLPATTACEHLMAGFSTDADDATVLIADIRGPNG